MSFRLPPLNTLRLFEASSRLLSFKLAADELHVTPSAVSHGIQVLEDWFGVALFHRNITGVTLTPAGIAYAPAVREALSDLASATSKITERKATGRLTVSVAPTFATKWLMPRIGEFARKHPSIVIEIDTSHRQVEFPLDGIDLAIRMARRARPGGAWIRLVRESLIPVCSPDLASKFGHLPLEAILAKGPIIEVTSVSESWSEWIKETKLQNCQIRSTLSFDTIQLAFEAAMQGLGIALGRRPLIDEDIEAGRLVQLGHSPISSGTSYWLIGSPRTFERSEARIFRKWLTQQLRHFSATEGVASQTKRAMTSGLKTGGASSSSRAYGGSHPQGARHDIEMENAE